jgi:hypothetical protein
MEQMFFPEETTVHITKVNYLWHQCHKKLLQSTTLVLP